MIRCWSKCPLFTIMSLLCMFLLNETKLLTQQWQFGNCSGLTGHRIIIIIYLVPLLWVVFIIAIQICFWSLFFTFLQSCWPEAMFLNCSCAVVGIFSNNSADGWLLMFTYIFFFWDQVYLHVEVITFQGKVRGGVGSVSLCYLKSSLTKLSYSSIYERSSWNTLPDLHAIESRST